MVRLFAKYGQPEPGDTVLDIGAHVGEFAIPATTVADHVYAFEPDDRNYTRLAGFGIDGLTVHQAVITDHTGQARMVETTDPSEVVLSAIGTDKPRNREFIVPAYRLSDLEFMADVDFVKIDAEGAEPEVLAGLGDYRPRRISVDAGPERNGERTVDAVVEALDAAGYTTTVTDANVVRGTYDA